MYYTNLQTIELRKDILHVQRLLQQELIFIEQQLAQGELSEEEAEAREEEARSQFGSLERVVLDLHTALPILDKISREPLTEEQIAEIHDAVWRAPRQPASGVQTIEVVIE